MDNRIHNPITDQEDKKEDILHPVLPTHNYSNRGRDCYSGGPGRSYLLVTQSHPTNWNILYYLWGLVHIFA